MNTPRSDDTHPRGCGLWPPHPTGLAEPRQRSRGAQESCTPEAGSLRPQSLEPSTQSAPGTHAGRGQPRWASRVLALQGAPHALFSTTALSQGHPRLC